VPTQLTLSVCNEEKEEKKKRPSNTVCQHGSFCPQPLCARVRSLQFSQNSFFFLVSNYVSKHHRVPYCVGGWVICIHFFLRECFRVGRMCVEKAGACAKKKCAKKNVDQAGSCAREMRILICTNIPTHKHTPTHPHTHTTHTHIRQVRNREMKILRGLRSRCSVFCV